MTRLSFTSLIALCLVYFATVQGRVGFGEGEQEWGYATVRPGAHMFWWLYFTTNKSVENFYEKPLVIWLQGGPGGSSTGYGNFEELGPYDVNLNPRNHTWVKNYNVLFIDNPVGTGFSYTEKYQSFATTNAQIAADLLETMNQFFKKLPEFRKVPTYITCESYGGKMAAEFALVWYKAQKAGTIQSNLKGVGLGDGWISPIDSVLTWAPFLLQTGMIDTESFEIIQREANSTRDAVLAGQWSKATTLWARTEAVIIERTNNIDFYNILTKSPARSQSVKYADAKARTIAMVQRTLTDDDKTLDKLMNSKVKEALKLDVVWGSQSQTVFNMLYLDFMKPVTHIVDRLLEETNLKVFVYTGQLDLIVDTPGTLQWVENLKWKNINTWKKFKRWPLIVDGIIEGYFKKYDNFGFFWVLRSGHMVPADNPAATSAILEHLTKS